MKKYTTPQTHSAFTMIELIFVIIVLGILAALAIPRLDRDFRQEAADNLLSAVRYTQHLALLDDKNDINDANWQQKFWMIKFTGGADAYYTISSDADKSGTVEKAECSLDPVNGKYMYHLSPNPTQADESTNVAIGHKYGINAVATNGGCAARHIAFDNFGRPHNGLKTTAGGVLASNDYATYMPSDCTMTFTFSDAAIDPIVMTIKTETGYAYIVGQEDL